MDRNTITGLVIIFIILITFNYLNKPSQRELEAAKRRADSIAQVESQKAKELEKTGKGESQGPGSESNPASVLPPASSVNNEAEELKGLYGEFAEAAKGTQKFITLENNLMKVRISTLGGKIYSVDLKNYKRYNGEPLVLFDGNQNHFGLNFFSQNKSIQTDNLYFTPSVQDTLLEVTGMAVPKGMKGREKFNEENPGKSQSLSLTLKTKEGVSIEYIYTLKYNSYMVGFDIRTSGLKKVTGANSEFVDLSWSIQMPRQEKISKYGEDRYSTVYYKYFEDDVNKLSVGKAESKTLSTKVKWVSFKDLFFSSVLIADQSFLNGNVSAKPFGESDTLFVSEMKTDLTLPLDPKGNENFPARFYFGPNQYNILKQYNISLDKEIYLGWSVIGYVNKWIVIPAFDFLRRFINNFGLIILLLTIYIKIIITPFTYKSYISQAKMRLLKPEIDEIQKKYGPDKKLESQQAVMALYKKAGVNPLGGCLPMLFQMPILVAMFYFFPISIELRQQSFLWAHDLSSYDSIMKLPFTIPMYGNHVSLFCLLMTVANILYVKYNNEMTSAGTQQMPGMKTMMYLMPLMFLFIFNSYASGLSLYYFLSLVLSFVQMYIFKKIVNEEQIHARLKAKQKMPVKKSKFQEKMDEMAKRQQQGQRRR